MALFERRPKEKLRKRLKESRISYMLMAPYMLFFITLTVIPVMVAIGLSFTYFNMLEAPSFVGLLNYERMFLDDEVFLIVLKNTLLFAFVTGPISYLISFFCAWLINEFGPKLRAVFTLAFYSPVLSGNLYVIWLYLFSGDQWTANRIIRSAGAISIPAQRRSCLLSPPVCSSRRMRGRKSCTAILTATIPPVSLKKTGIT